MNKTAFIIIAAFLSCSAMAQNFPRHEFSVNAGGGASGFQSRPTVGKDHWTGTATFGLGYHYLFHQNWGISTGINFAAYNGKISIKNYDQQQTATNAATGNAFDFLVSSSNYKETQQAMMIAIPLMAQYQYQFEGKTAFYSALGFKAGIPVSAKSRSKGAFTTKGYYPNLNVTYDNFPDYGFVTDQPFPDDKTGIRVKTAFMASAECGMKWRLVNTTSLYAGIYADFGLNNMLNKKTATHKNLVVYQSNLPAKLVYNTAAELYAGKMRPFAAGVTLRFAFQSVKTGCMNVL